MNNKQLKISVIMGIYNCQDTLVEAIDSIINQTYTNWELIMCDDGSVDNTYIIAEKYKRLYPEKIVLLKNPQNKGLNYTLNRCLSVAKGDYIARMDGDDISLLNRFEKEVEFLDNNPEYAIVSTAMNMFDENGVWGKSKGKNTPSKSDLVKGSPFSHPACMVRKEAFDAVGGYSEHKRLLRVEDYHLWYKMYLNGFVGANLDDVMYLYRDDRNGFNKRKFKYRINEAYVKYMIIRDFNLPILNYTHLLRPIIVGLLPYPIYKRLHRNRLK